MPDSNSVWHSGEDVQRVENVLDDTAVAPETRRLLLRRASAGLLGAGGLAAVLAGCGTSNSKSGSQGSSSSATSSMSSSTSSASAAEITTIIDTAATAEALAVTYLTAVLKMAHGTPLAKYADILKAANAEEYDHYRALRSLGAKPVATRFWVPHDFFGGSKLPGVLPTLHVAETLFVNAYLIAITQFAKAGKASLARYASEIAGTEAQHLVLVNYAAGDKPPNDLGFADYSITSIGGIVSALEKVGVGFGKQGSKPGKFASFAPPPASTVTHVRHHMPA